MSTKNLILIPFNLPGKIYRSPMPFSAFDVDQSTLEEYLQAGVDTVVMLTEPGEDLRRARRDLQQVYTENQLETMRFPIEDFNTPDDLGDFGTVVDKIIQRLEKGENIAIHCFAGRGRTGMLAALLARRILGVDGQAAIEWVRQYFPAIETAAQEQLVRDFPLDD